MTDIQGDFAEAIRLRDQGDLAGSLAILSRLANSTDATAAILAVLGDVYWDANNLPEAIASFRKATELSPRSELASLGLFHALWESDRVDDAFTEMKRFVSLADSPEYRTLLNDIRDSSGDA